ncbi:valacyclovir hydrolase [Sarcoptes scabiei]|nr:valacyclovir hydrolase [Sarcoptes scabiei]
MTIINIIKFKQQSIAARMEELIRSIITRPDRFITRSNDLKVDRICQEALFFSFSTPLFIGAIQTVETNRKNKKLIKSLNIAFIRLIFVHFYLSGEGDLEIQNQTLQCPLSLSLSRPFF